ncbi:MAG TPA: pyruvate:ferredoxin (flavodoxin) oxidoreductase, partial [Phycisphaerae bacterium]|nr:pyruvate:ferredoxin (flavodoxin) oxidoreductase [Phycisphaerae bacterium]
MPRRMVMMDGNQAVAHVAHKVNEVIAIYPITPSSPMGEHADEMSAKGLKNIWGTVPLVIEMQSEGGASAAVHGALQTGSLTTTFTASQGLLLMIPSMYKIAGELSPTCFHVSARSLACQALSIFGDHGDVMAVRQTGFALIASGSLQEAMDMAIIGSAATLATRVPFLHFFDGFRTSHEEGKVEELTVDDMKAMIDDKQVAAHRARAMSPDRPTIRGTSQNPDVYFQGRETVNKYYLACPQIVQQTMDRFAKIVGRQYKLFDYVGAADADRVIVLMGSGAEAAHETVEALTAAGEKVGVVKVRLYRPFSDKHFIDALPRTVKTLVALDRTKEPGAAGEPLCLDAVNAVAEAGRQIRVLGGRYGLSSKEFTPAMIKGVFDEAAKSGAMNHFTVGIDDDVTHTSIDYDPSFSTEGDDVVRAIFFGLGSDGTVSANRNSIKIIGEETGNYAQGYFVYDSKKAGGMTVSHLRFGPRPIRSTYLVNKANFVACHQFSFLERFNMLSPAVGGATFLLNAPYEPGEVWDHMPREVQQQIIDKKLKFYAINAYEVAKATGMGARINTIMQTCFFYLSGILPQDDAIKAIKDAIKKTYGKKGDAIVQQNYNAVDHAIANLHEIKVPAKATSKLTKPPVVPKEAPQFVQNVTATIMASRGDDVPVSAMPDDGVWPTATTQWEKRNIAMEIPAWDPAVCIQCAKCSIACPHATIRAKVYDAAILEKTTGGTPVPPTFKSADAKGKEFEGLKWTIQVAPEDCTGCGECVQVCPAKNKLEPAKKAINMASQLELRQTERENYKFFLSIPDYDRSKLRTNTVKGSQLCRPLFEYSGACAGCGETPYVKLVTQLFGDRAIIGNATGCSSIYGGNLPTTPYCVNSDGRGPTWNNSLFEDAAEFAFGFRLTLDKQLEFAHELLAELRGEIGADLAGAILAADQSTEAGIAEQRKRVEQLEAKLAGMKTPRAAQLAAVGGALVRKSVWAFGGDGWAYDIGFGGLDHVLACGRDINVLVLDTQVYSNTGGQCSKATMRGAVAKFAAGGKPGPKKDLGMMAMTYGNIYIAQVAMGASDVQTVKAFAEAESYPGPSLIIAYSHCISHGINMTRGYEQQKLAVASGAWPLYRYDPRLAEQGKNPLQLDSKEPSIPLEQYIGSENRWQMLHKTNPAEAKRLAALAQQDVTSKWQMLKYLAAMSYAPQAPAAAP